MYIFIIRKDALTRPLLFPHATHTRREREKMPNRKHKIFKRVILLTKCVYCVERVYCIQRVCKVVKDESIV